jgi:hypothetical protein
MRFAALALAALAATGCMGRATSGGSDSTSVTANLEISVSIRGSEAPTRVWTLRCPAGGTLLNAARACRKLEQVPHPFAPVPKGTACTQIYGGPEIADVRGVFRGRRVAAHFSRGNGCEITRWNRVRFLFPSE